MSREIEMMMDLYDKNGNRVAKPLCRKCETPMVDDGTCFFGCCDDFKCPKCGYRLRVECAA